MNDLEKKASLALSNVLIEMPHLAGLAAGVRLQLDERVQTAGVFASGRMLFNPGWLEKLPLPAATFVMAHELMHLMLMTHERAEGSDPQLVNVAHDIIINQMLQKELDMKTPANGLIYNKVIQKSSWYRFENKASASLEEVVALLQTDGRPDKIKNIPCWSLDAEGLGNTNEDTVLGGALRLVLEQPASSDKAQAPAQMTDVFTSADEQRLFPEETPKSLKPKIETIRSLTMQAASAHQIHDAVANTFEGIQGMGFHPGRGTITFEAIRSQYNPPWEWALQQWMEATTPARNTYARPSRRGEHHDFVRPGRERTGQTLHIVLDTSGSMTGVLPKALGTIASFCESTGVERQSTCCNATPE